MKIGTQIIIWVFIFLLYSANIFGAYFVSLSSFGTALNLINCG